MSGNNAKLYLNASDNAFHLAHVNFSRADFAVRSIQLPDSHRRTKNSVHNINNWPTNHECRYNNK